MNWLAHVFLSKPDIHFRLGNLLADRLKCKGWEGMPLGVEAGMTMHRKIDAYTDSDLMFIRSKERLGSGLLRGVVIDVVYDHMLTKNWGQFSSVSLEAFLAEFYKAANAAVGSYPSDAKAFILSIVESNRLGLYGDIEGVKAGMERIDSRLSQRVLNKERTSDYYLAVIEQYDGIERDFLNFFPRLLESTEL